MSETFTKLFSSITASTIWAEDSDTRIVWITLLAMADRHGYVGASVPGLALRAQVSLDKTQEALEKFMSPDPYSRSPEYEGRRIAKVDRGWNVLNYERFRDMRDEEARKEQDRIRKRRERSRTKQEINGPIVTYRDSLESPPESAQAEAEAEADTDKLRTVVQDDFERLVAIWESTCVPAGFARVRRTQQQAKAAHTRMQEPGWLETFTLACQCAARDPFYRGGSSSGWVMTFGWLLKPGNAEKTAERGQTRKANGNGGDLPSDTKGIPEWDAVMAHYAEVAPGTRDYLSESVVPSLEGGVLRLTVRDEHRAEYLSRHIDDIRAISTLPVLIQVDEST